LASSYREEVLFATKLFFVFVWGRENKEGRQQTTISALLPDCKNIPLTHFLSTFLCFWKRTTNKANKKKNQQQKLQDDDGLMGSCHWRRREVCMVFVFMISTKFVLLRDIPAAVLWQVGKEVRTVFFLLQTYD